MPSLREHRAFARTLAKMLNIDVNMAELASMLPDFDSYKPLKHRKTLHKPILSLVFCMLKNNRQMKGGVAGFLSHLFMDKFKLTSKAISMLERLQYERPRRID